MKSRLSMIIAVLLLERASHRGFLEGLLLWLSAAFWTWDVLRQMAKEIREDEEREENQEDDENEEAEAKGAMGEA